MPELKIYQPWSAPVLHTSLPDILVQKLIQLTDLITEDIDHESHHERLAGEIENELTIDPILLTNISFKDYISQLCWEYFKVFASQFGVDPNSDVRYMPPSLSVMKKKIENIEILGSWFNNQQDNEYNPLHDHATYFSGVIYLKIPEYLPSRKSKNGHLDGSILFVQNESNIITCSTISISPRVGDIFLFPSTLKHMVYPFRTVNGKGIRRSLSFNLDSVKDYDILEAQVNYHKQNMKKEEIERNIKYIKKC